MCGCVYIHFSFLSMVKEYKIRTPPTFNWFAFLMESRFTFGFAYVSLHSVNLY